VCHVRAAQVVVGCRCRMLAGKRHHEYDDDDDDDDDEYDDDDDDDSKCDKI